MMKIQTLEGLADHLDLLAEGQRTQARKRPAFAAGRSDAYAEAARLVRAFALEGTLEIAGDELAVTMEDRPTPGEEFRTTAGWKVKVNYVEIGPEEYARRMATLARILLQPRMKPK